MPRSLLKIAQQVEHPGLDRDVERRHRLVEDQQFRIEGERPGDADPLLLAAREIGRIAIGVLAAQADEVEQLRYPAADLLAPATVDAAAARRERRTTGSRGSSDAVGSWKTTCHLAPDRTLLGLGSAPRRRRPAPRSNRIPARPGRESASAWSICPSRTRRPAPACGRARMSKLMPSTARISPRLRRNTTTAGDRVRLHEIGHLQHHPLFGCRLRGAGGCRLVPPIRREQVPGAASSTRMHAAR